MEKTSYTSVDVFKFIAALMVVAIHCKPLANIPTADYIMSCLCRIAVPFFFVFGSFIFFSKNKPIGKYIKRLFILYAVWFCIELPFVYIRFFAGNTISEGLVPFLNGLAFSNTFYASWYITATWQATLIVYLLAKYTNKYVLFFVGVCCAILSVSNAMYAHVADTQMWCSFVKFTGACKASNSFITAIPYCIIGRYIASHRYSIKTSTHYIFTLIVILQLFEIYICKNFYEITDSYWSLYIIAFILTTYLLSYSISINEKISTTLRKMSILIYLIHMIVFHILPPFDNFYKYFTVTAITLILAYLIVRLSEKYKFFRYLY